MLPVTYSAGVQMTVNAIDDLERLIQAALAEADQRGFRMIAIRLSEALDLLVANQPQPYSTSFAAKPSSLTG